MCMELLLDEEETQDSGREHRLHPTAPDASSPPEGPMAIDRSHVPHDRRTAAAATGAIVVLAAIIIFLMITLMRNVGAY
jgi:hypothetical protein